MSTLHAVHRDHNHLLALASAAGSALRGGDRSPLDALAVRLRRHLRLEEEQLFPAAERLVEDPRFHLTATLRREHGMLRAILAGVEAELAHDNLAGAIGDLRELASALGLHERKERELLYPMLERRLGGQDLSALLMLEGGG